MIRVYALNRLAVDGRTTVRRRNNNAPVRRYQTLFAREFAATRTITMKIDNEMTTLMRLSVWLKERPTKSAVVAASL